MSTPALAHWLDTHAQALDVGNCEPEQVLPQLAAADVLRISVATDHGGLGSDVAESVEADALMPRSLGPDAAISHAGFGLDPQLRHPQSLAQRP